MHSQVTSLGRRREEMKITKYDDKSIRLELAEDDFNECNIDIAKVVKQFDKKKILFCKNLNDKIALVDTETETYYADWYYHDFPVKDRTKAEINELFKRGRNVVVYPTGDAVKGGFIIKMSLRVS